MLEFSLYPKFMSLEQLKELGENIAKHWSRNKPEPDKEALTWRKDLSFWQHLKELRGQIEGAIIYYSIGIRYWLVSEIPVPIHQDPQPTTETFKENPLFEKITRFFGFIDQIRQQPHHN